LSEEIALTLT